MTVWLFRSLLIFIDGRTDGPAPNKGDYQGLPWIAMDKPWPPRYTKMEKSTNPQTDVWWRLSWTPLGKLGQNSKSRNVDRLK